jgi:putative ABC transport system permease protein
VRALDLVRFSGLALVSHRLRSALSLLGVAIGVASVILLTALGEGARLYVVGQFAQLGSNLLIVLPGKTETTGGAPIFGGTPNPITLDDAEALRRRIPTVRRLAPLALGEAELRYRDRIRQATVIGTTDEMREIRHMRMRIGRYLPRGNWHQGARVAVIGDEIQREIFGDRNPLGEILHVGDMRFRVIGVIEHRGVSLGNDLDQLVQVPVDQALSLFDQRGLFRVLVEVTSRPEIETTSKRIVALMTERHGEEDVTVITQDSVLSAFNAILRVLTAALGAIAAVSLTVAGVAIMNVMLVSVSERRREIGLLKAIGATSRQVILAFLVEAVILSAAGGLLGMAVGAVSCGAARLLWPSFPVQPPAWAVGLAVGVSAGVGLVFGLVPARRAAALEPVAALQGR